MTTERDITTPIPVEIALSIEQQQALEAFRRGDNIFLTGPGGSGKTLLIKNMVDICKEKSKRVQVCALTGCAAILLNCQAKTVHSWAGIGLANGEADMIVKRVIKNKYKVANWNKIDVLIIDEVSMMSQKLFEILDEIGKKRQIPYSQRPFGGLQIVFSGDFYQLPPVNSNNYASDENYDETSSAFCFESRRWTATFPTIIQLKTIFRQTDAVYTAILNQIRVGKLYKSSLDILAKHVGKTLPENFKPTILLPRRKDAERINATELSKLQGEQKVYKLAQSQNNNPTATTTAGSGGSAKIPKTTAGLAAAAAAAANLSRISPEQIEFELNLLTNSILADKEIVLKKGTQVMCIANIDMESVLPIVNGSQGIVVDFVGNLPLIRFNNGTTRTVGYHQWVSETCPTVCVTQIPLIYAWAITIHKSQGVSLDMAEIDAGSNIFECGQTYVALSRIKSLDGLYLTDFNAQKIKVNKKVQAYYASINNVPVVPVVPPVMLPLQVPVPIAPVVVG